MALPNGAKLGPYVIEAVAGAGGMGEVYKARDTRLERTVAVKVLPAGAADNPDVRARFEREAKTISSLNHPNICTLYDIGQQDGVDYLVMEYIEGTTLADRLQDGPLQTQELFAVAVQIADALDKAHRQGLVHRDLKPGNIMLTREGAKLLDFGLAKLTTSDAGIQAISAATHTTPLTGEGAIVGTLQYMSPEQLEGREADARSDIFSFGAVLYEMATGKSAFSGSGRASLIASIMKETPQPISQVQPMSPPMLERAVLQCLEKDAEYRWQSAGDLKRSLQWIAEGGSQAGIPKTLARHRKNREKLAWSIAGALLLVAAIGFTLYGVNLPGEPELIRTGVLPPENFSYELDWGGHMALSPDGSKIAFMATGKGDGRSGLWLYSLATGTAMPLPGTEDCGYPFWSPDGRQLGFFAFPDDKLKKMLISGGPALTVCDAPSGRGGTWNENNQIVFSPSQEKTGLHIVPAAGGEARPVTTLDSSLQDYAHRWPTFLPDGKHVLFFIRTDGGSGSEQDAIAVASIETGEVTRLLNARSNPVYAAGHLLFARDGVLMAQPFSAGSRELTGDAVPILENVAYSSRFSRGSFSASVNGRLVYQTGETATGSEVVLYDRAGRILDTLLRDETVFSVAWSPDERLLAFNINDQTTSNTDLWIYDFDRRLKTRLTFTDKPSVTPIWSPDGDTVYYREAGAEGFTLWRKSVSGLNDPKLLWTAPGAFWPEDITKDGGSILFSMEDTTTGKWGIFELTLADPVQMRPLIQPPGNTGWSSLSPDNRWLAYMSDESGEEEVYVTSYPTPSGKWQVSTNAGDRPQWRADGREIYYLDNLDVITAVPVEGSSSGFRVGAATPLFSVRGIRPGDIFDVSANGERVVVNQLPQDRSEPTMIFVQNWPQLIEE